MPKSTKLFSDALLQVEELQRFSVEQAKEMFLETMTPRIQTMVQNSLNEKADEQFEERLNEVEQEELEEDFDISGFIQEDEEPEEEVPAAPAAPEAPISPEGGEESFGDESGATDDLGMDAGADDLGSVDGQLSDETALTDLTVGELKSLFQDLISGGSDDMTPDLDADASDDPELDSIEPDDAEGGEESAPEAPASEEDDDDLNLGEILSEVERTLNSNKEVAKLKKELKEAKEVITKMTTTLTESNLLNAKLIYVNTLFKKLALSEAQKATVVKSIDQATTPKEAKLVFESLDKTFAKVAKKPIKEALGFASTPTGSAPARPTAKALDENTMSRLQYLAGIKKS